MALIVRETQLKAVLGASFRGNSLCLESPDLPKISRIFKDLARHMIQFVISQIRVEKKNREEANWERMQSMSPKDCKTGMVGTDLQRQSAFKQQS